MRWGTMLLVCVAALATCSRAQNGVCGSTGTKTKCSDAYFTDFKTDPFNCGGCHKVCAGGISCCYGQCQDCPGGGFKCANNVCTNLLTDPQNCGSCGAACPPDMPCINGACACPTDKPDYCGFCTSTLTDNTNCGSCFRRCYAGWSCVSGVCTAPPSPPSPSPVSPSPSPTTVQPSPSPIYPSPSPKSAPCSPACKPGYSCTNNQCVKIGHFLNPKINGVRVDFCLSADRTQCGPPVADIFCKAKGYTHVLGYSNPVTQCPTFYVGSLQNCRRRKRLCSCSAFSAIHCVKVQPGWDQVSTGPP